MEKITAFERRKNRVRFAIKQKGSGRIRLCVNRSERHIEAQLIDDKKAITLAAASSKEKDFKAKGSTVEGAKLIGQMIAERALKNKHVLEDNSTFNIQNSKFLTTESATKFADSASLFLSEPIEAQHIEL